jgi:hypothetical protein
MARTQLEEPALDSCLQNLMSPTFTQTPQKHDFRFLQSAMLLHPTQPSGRHVEANRPSSLGSPLHQISALGRVPSLHQNRHPHVSDQSIRGQARMLCLGTLLCNLRHLIFTEPLQAWRREIWHRPTQEINRASAKTPAALPPAKLSSCQRNIRASAKRRAAAPVHLTRQLPQKSKDRHHPPRINLTRTPVPQRSMRVLLQFRCDDRDHPFTIKAPRRPHNGRHSSLLPSSLHPDSNMALASARARRHRLNNTMNRLHHFRGRSQFLHHQAHLVRRVPSTGLPPHRCLHPYPFIHYLCGASSQVDILIPFPRRNWMRLKRMRVSKGHRRSHLYQ